MADTSITAAVLAKIAESASSGGTVVSYRDSFNDLWSWIAEDGARGPLPETLKGRLCIVWDGVPDLGSKSEFAFEKHLTVYDWIAALVAVWARLPDDGGQALDIVIFDCTRHVRWGDSFSCQMARGLVGLLPWLRVVRNTAAGRSEMISSLANGRTRETVEFRMEDWKRVGNLVKRLWVSDLCRAGDRHSVANAIGPIVLSDAFAANGFGPPIDRETAVGRVVPESFWIFLRALDLLPPPEARRYGTCKGLLGGLVNERLVKEDHFGRFKKLGFLLVDDQAHVGFHHVLAQLLFGAHESLGEAGKHLTTIASEGRFRLDSVVEPSCLLEWLKHCVQHTRSDWYRARVFGKKSIMVSDTDMLPGDLPNFDVLFLDLRLHGIGKSDEVRSKEKLWVETLISIHRTWSAGFGISQVQRNALHGALTSAVALAETPISEASSAGGSRFAYLALLPILISICDPTVPIIIFSSTQQREVVELMAPFPNIIVKFAKPSLSGYFEEDRDALAGAGRRLQASLNQALELHEKRVLWEISACFALSPKAKNEAARIYAITPPPYIISRKNSKTGVEVPSIFNVLGKNQRDFPSDPLFEVAFFQMIKDYIISNKYYETMSSPYNFLEGCILYTIRKSSRGILIKLITEKHKIINAIHEMDGECDPHTDINLDFITEIRKSRNIFDHGNLILRGDSDISTKGLYLMLNFLGLLAPAKLYNYVSQIIGRT
jgi:hypothetical protein